MLRKLNLWLIAASQRSVIFPILIALIVFLFIVIGLLNRQFQAIAGIPIFDTSNTSSASELLLELPLYRGQAYPFYIGFALLDLMFPLAIVVFIAILWALLLGTNTMPVARQLLNDWMFPVWALVGVIFDWEENITLLIAVHINPSPQIVLELAVQAKQLKWQLFSLSLLITTVLVALWLTNRFTPKKS